jgi:twitching motility two-component system response regulator PilG
MQGNLEEINICTLLQLFASEQKTGILHIETETNSYGFTGKNISSHITQLNNFSDSFYLSPKKYWLIFFCAGEITYIINSKDENNQRLKDYLAYYKIDELLLKVPECLVKASHPREYTELLFFLKEQILSQKNGQQIIENIIKESLFEILIDRPKKFIFRPDYLLNPQINSLRVYPLIKIIMNQIRLWKQFYPYVQCPNQYLAILNYEQLQLSVSSQAYETLVDWMQKKASLLQLSRYLNHSPSQIAKAIYPYLKKGWVKMLDSNDKEVSNFCVGLTSKKSQIVCVDDDIANCKKVEYILKHKNYEITIVKDSIQALSIILQNRPDLIICNANMPQLSGYELCSMLQQSQVCQQTPIIMLLDQENFLGIIQTRFAYSSEYLTKPFSKNELLLIVEKYLGVSCPVTVTINDLSPLES